LKGSIKIECQEINQSIFIKHKECQPYEIHQEAMGYVAPKTQQLSFYKPVIDHDLKIASNACGNQLALNSFTDSN
jgi:hypothetical protein